MLNGIVEFLGWFGAVTVLAGYILFSTGKLPNGPVYQLLNLVGGLAIAVNVGAHHAIPSLIVNGIWAIVAVVVLAKMLRTRRAAERGEPVGAATAQVLVEPPLTTAVLPVVGPALRDHDDVTTSTVGAGIRTAEHDAVRADAPMEAPTAPAPMTETVPVITATIALALVAAAQRDQHERDQHEHNQHEHDQDEHDQDERDQHERDQRGPDEHDQQTRDHERAELA